MQNAECRVENAECGMEEVDCWGLIVDSRTGIQGKDSLRWRIEIWRGRLGVRGVQRTLSAFNTVLTQLLWRQGKVSLSKTERLSYGSYFICTARVLRRI